MIDQMNYVHIRESFEPLNIIYHPVDGNRLPINIDISVVGIFVVLPLQMKWMIFHFPVDPEGD